MDDDGYRRGEWLRRHELDRCGRLRLCPGCGGAQKGLYSFAARYRAAFDADQSFGNLDVFFADKPLLDCFNRQCWGGRLSDRAMPRSRMYEFCPYRNLNWHIA